MWYLGKPMNSSHDHGNCELCDYIEHELGVLKSDKSILSGRLIDARTLLRRVLSCGLDESPQLQGSGFTPTRQEVKASELAHDIAAFLDMLVREQLQVGTPRDGVTGRRDGQKNSTSDALANSLDAALGALETQAFQENTTLSGTVKEVVAYGMCAVAIPRKNSTSAPSAIGTRGSTPNPSPLNDPSKSVNQAVFGSAPRCDAKAYPVEGQAEPVIICSHCGDVSHEPRCPHATDRMMGSKR